MSTQSRRPPPLPQAARPDDVVQPVLEDLQYLRREWNGDTSDDALRRSSTVLRRLLVEGDMQRAWKALGLHGSPQVDAYELDPAIAGIDPGRIILASAGGGVHKKFQASAVVVVNYTMSKGELQRRSEIQPVATRMDVRRFVEHVCMLVRGEPIRRRHVIKYVANKLAGAHFDSARKHDDRLFLLLDEFYSSPRIVEKPVVYFELLSTGQSLANSVDVDSFIEAAKRREQRS